MIAFPKVDEPGTEEAIQTVILRFLPSGIIQMSMMDDSGRMEIYEGRPQPGGELAVGAIVGGGLLVTENRKMNIQKQEE